MSVSTLLQGFKGFFSRAFWFASFLPVAIVAAAHAALAIFLFDIEAGAWISASVGENAGTAMLIFAGLAVLAYALGPLTPFLAGMLDGSLLPGPVHDRLRNGRRAAWRATDVEYRAALERHARAERYAHRIVPALKQHKEQGDATGGANQAALIDAAEAAIRQLAIQPDAGESDDQRQPPLIELAALRAAGKLLGDALAGNMSTYDAAAAPEDDPSRRLAEAHRSFDDLVRKVRKDAEHRFDAFLRRNPTFDPHDWQATRLGDARYARERYAKAAYDVDFDYLWPRIRMAIADGEEDEGKGVPRQISDASAQVGFAVLLLVLSLTVPLVWLPVILVAGKSVWMFLAVGLLAPLLVRLLYEIVIQSEIAFGRMVETAIDRYRLAVFPLLDMPLPATLSAEREMWARLAQVGVSDRAVELVYSHPTKAEK